MYNIPFNVLLRGDSCVLWYLLTDW